MRIGFDAKRAFNNATGLGNYSRFVISSFTRLYPQHEYFLFTPSVKKEFEHFYSGGFNIKVISPDSLLGKAFPALWRSYAIADMCNELTLDVFHGLSNELPVGIGKFPGKKLVTIHDLIFLRYPDYYNNIDRYIYTQKFRHACEKADMVIAASHQTRKDIIAHFHTAPEKISVIYQNCDERFTQEPGDTDQEREIIERYALPEKYMLCVGTLEERKNQETVLKAFARLENKGTKLVFVGRQTAYAGQLQEYVDRNNLDRHVMFLHDVAHEHLPVIYRHAMLFIYASEFEGFGIPVLEALRSGVPVLAANTSSLPEVGGEAAGYFDFKDDAELSEHMRVLLQDENKRKEMTGKGLIHASQFDSKPLMEQLAAAYKKSSA